MASRHDLTATYGMSETQRGDPLNGSAGGFNRRAVEGVEPRCCQCGKGKVAASLGETVCIEVTDRERYIVTQRHAVTEDSEQADQFIEAQVGGARIGKDSEQPAGHGRANHMIRQGRAGIVFRP